MVVDRVIHAAAPVLSAENSRPACEVSRLRLTSRTNDMRRRGSAGREISRRTRDAAHCDVRDRSFHAALQNHGAGGEIEAMFAAMQYVLVTRLLELLFRLQFH